jgi:hypothetical protein
VGHYFGAAPIGLFMLNGGKKWQDANEGNQSEIF